MKISWRTLPTVLLSDEILDKAFTKARKASERVEDPHKIFRTRKQMIRMVQTSADSIRSHFDNMVSTWPSLDHIPEFDYAMIDACVGCDDYRKNLATLQWAGETISKIAGQNVKKITRTANIEFMHSTRREFYGRVGSIMGRVEKPLKWLNEARETLKQLPQIDTAHPCIVVCGAPNVGKSAFIEALSSGKTEVNHYPFTTKRIHLGHFLHRRLQYQMVDTPGLLDRSMESRNAIEMQAIAALKHLGSLVLFLLDPTEKCGTSLVEQQNLYAEIENLLEGTDILLVTSKADLIEPRPELWDEVAKHEQEYRSGEIDDIVDMPLLFDSDGHVTMSAIENVGMDSLRMEIVKRVMESQPDDPLALPEGWHMKTQGLD